MTLQPCSQCRRHIAETEPACPFCSEPRSRSAAPIASLYGRWSRAAVFAGVAGCYTSNPPPQYYQQPPPPPPPNDQPPPPPPPDDGQQFAQPPAATGTIRGVVTDGSSGVAATNLPVIATQPGMPARQVVTDASGRYTFTNLPPGRYALTFGHQTHPRQPPPRRVVDLADGATQQINVTIVPQPYVQEPYDHSNIPKPYGAPPARVRIV